MSDIHHYAQNVRGAMGAMLGTTAASKPTFEDVEGHLTVTEKSKLLDRSFVDRRRMNLVAICQVIFVPWIFFCVVLATMSFSIRYQHPLITFLIVALSFLIVALVGYASFISYSRMKRGLNTNNNTWLIFIFFALAVAWVAAVFIGDYLYTTYLLPFYDLQILNSYPSVDPATERGQQVMDAGRVYFVPGTHINIPMTAAFKNEDTYCAVPIVNGTSPPTSYDFWAVGMNCCSGSAADFHCKNYDNLNAHAGVRLMKDEERPFYRLAVQQAEATYNIKAEHPIFFHWMQDPNEHMNWHRDTGFKYYNLGILSHFAFNLFCVTVAVVGFAKMGFH